MPERDRETPNTKCPRCGKEFYCGCIEGDLQCWCMSLPVVKVSEEYDGHGCLCPDCLQYYANNPIFVIKDIMERNRG